ncbi:MAG: TROVE domain-containing protein, partial [Planctomycetes bacterium]|nr:TROVE domain-containing protein [Planctomycetota bacterium]
MANKKIFKSPSVAQKVPAANAVNDAGGKAYKREDKQALAQIACTNTFNGTYYASADQNLELAKKAALALKNDPEFLAKVAVYSRNKGYMKDMPAFLVTLLADLDTKTFRKIFPIVIDNGKMLRNFCQMARSGVFGKARNLSSGTIRHAIQQWFDVRGPWALFKASIGNDPTMKDMLRMARPRPNTPEKNALFGYFLDKDVAIEKLPQVVREYEAFKRDKSLPVPNVDFRMLDSLGLSDDQWKEIARNAPWMMTRMNLNTFQRHGVFKDKELVKIVADRLRDKKLIEEAKQFPYQLFSAWKAITSNTSELPFEIHEAVQDAMELSIDNVPEIKGQIYVCVDCSGSMGSPITGYRQGSTSTVRCVDVAGLIASSIVRKNRSAQVYTFSHNAVKVSLNPRDTVITNTLKLNKAGGGTNISAPLRDLNAAKAKGDAVIYISDNESWLDRGG